MIVTHRRRPSHDVWVYVDNRHPVGHPDHLQVFANKDAANEWFEQQDPERVAFSYPVQRDIVSGVLPRNVPPQTSSIMSPENSVLRAIQSAQHILARHVKPGGLDEKSTIDALFSVLDDEHVIEAVEGLELGLGDHRR